MYSAVLFSGGLNELYNYRRYENDILLALSVLPRAAGFRPDAVKVLLGPGGKTLSVGGHRYVTRPGTRDELETAIKGSANSVSTDGVFFFMATNHGGQTAKGTPQAKLWCWDEEAVPDDEFTAWCAALPSATQIFLFGQCYSGGFIDNLASHKRLVMSASHYNEVSYARRDLEHDEFLFHFLQSISAGAATYGHAYDDARRKDTRPETPQISDPAAIAQRRGLLNA